MDKLETLETASQQQNTPRGTFESPTAVCDHAHPLGFTFFLVQKALNYNSK